MRRVKPKEYPEDKKYEAKINRTIKKEMAEEAGHACTEAEAKHIEGIVWKYFSKEFADKVMIAYGNKPGDREKAYDDFWNMEREWDNRKKASKEINDYISKRKIYSVGQTISKEASAVIYDSGFIFQN